MLKKNAVVGFYDLRHGARFRFTRGGSVYVRVGYDTYRRSDGQREGVLVDCVPMVHPLSLDEGELLNPVLTRNEYQSKYQRS